MLDRVKPEGARPTPEPLRVVLPLLTYVPGAMGGSETYVRELVRALDARQDVVVQTLVPASAAGALGARHETVVPSVVQGGSPAARLRGLVHAAVARDARQLLGQADVVHFPFTVPVPFAPRGKPWVQTLLDVQHRDLPTLFSRAERAYRAAAYDAPARRAHVVLTLSDFCCERIREVLGIPQDRIHVAHLAVDTTRFTPNLGTREQFVLYPAAAWRHKNHALLLKAMEVLRRDVPGLRLVLTGADREKLGSLPDWVTHRGLVGGQELERLYQRAACLAFPSLYEGFGLPPLEAMASGCPVAVSRSGSLPEVCGDAAVYFDGANTLSMATAIREAIARRDDIVRRGLARASTFTWDACADAHVKAYIRVSRASAPRR